MVVMSDVTLSIVSSQNHLPHDYMTLLMDDHCTAIYSSNITVCSIYFAKRTFYLKSLENMAVVCLNTLTVIVTLIKTLYELKLIMHHLCPFNVHSKDYLAF
jgi:hypothetical protein